MWRSAAPQARAAICTSRQARARAPDSKTRASEDGPACRALQSTSSAAAGSTRLMTARDHDAASGTASAVSSTLPQARRSEAHSPPRRNSVSALSPPPALASASMRMSTSVGISCRLARGAKGAEGAAAAARVGRASRCARGSCLRAARVKGIARCCAHVEASSAAVVVVQARKRRGLLCSEEKVRRSASRQLSRVVGAVGGAPLPPPPPRLRSGARRSRSNRERSCTRRHWSSANSALGVSAMCACASAACTASVASGSGPRRCAHGSVSTPRASGAAVRNA